MHPIDLRATSHVFLPGHRIREEISSSNFPRFDRNLNTGEDQATGRRWETARQTVFHDQRHPSHIVLPVIPLRRSEGRCASGGAPLVSGVMIIAAWASHNRALWWSSPFVRVRSGPMMVWLDGKVQIMAAQGATRPGKGIKPNQTENYELDSPPPRASDGRQVSAQNPLDIYGCAAV